MSHELRTPLNAVIGFAQLLEMAATGSLSEKQTEFVRHIQHGGEHLLRLIDDVLSFAKVDAGRLPITVTDVALADLLDDVQPIIAPLAAPAEIGRAARRERVWQYVEISVVAV